MILDALSTFNYPPATSETEWEGSVFYHPAFACTVVHTVLFCKEAAC
jgi:hypothetical protein